MRRPVGRRERTPPGGYEVRFRLERSYKRYGWVFLFGGIFGLGVAIMTGHLVLCIVAGPSLGAGLWILRNDPREYLEVVPRRHLLRLTRVYGRKVQVRREYDLSQFVRLEMARYHMRPKGMRCMILLFRADGSVEKVDDRIDDEVLGSLCRDVAETAGLAFIDRGRIDLDPSERLTTESTESTESAPLNG